MGFGNRKKSILKLDSSQDYVDLYKKMGCIDQMSEFYHLYDDIGHMCRVYWPATVSYIEQSGPKMWCTEHEKWHKEIDMSSKFLRGTCPISLDESQSVKYYDDIHFKWVDAILQHPDEEAVKFMISKARSIFFYVYLYDEYVMSNPCRDHHEDHYTGLIPVIDIDVNGSTGSRRDMLDKDVFKEFEIMDNYVSDQLEKNDLTFHKHTSGNGLYFIIDAMTIKHKEVEPFNTAFKAFCMDMSDYLSKLKLIKIDAMKVPGWNRYYKIPFSLHQDFDRIALPLSPKDNLDYDYIKYHSNPLNLNADKCKKIWSDSDYDK